MIVAIPQPPKYEARCDTPGCQFAGPEALNESAARILATHDRINPFTFDGETCICHRCQVLEKAASPTE